MKEYVKKEKPCLYELGVVCENPTPERCRKCGWDPAVSRKRRERLRVLEAHGILTQKKEVYDETYVMRSYVQGENRLFTHGRRGR